jgi:hypothetical protein
MRRSERRPTLTARSGGGSPTIRSLLVVLAALVVLPAAGCAGADIKFGSTPDAPPASDGTPRKAYMFALIGNDGEHLEQERRAGIEAKVLALSWRDFYLAEGEVNTRYVEHKREELRDLRDKGFEIILASNFHDTPPWVHENYEHTYYVNQFGERWTGINFYQGQPRDNGDANLVFNHRLRGLVGAYMKDVFREFGTDFWAVRLGGGVAGEVTYPHARFGGRSNLYWAYDDNAQRRAADAGVGGWRPGAPSQKGLAGRFLNWYLNSLVGFQNWQVDMVRAAGYSGRIIMLYPGWGIRPGQIEEATATKLDGSTPAEVNGEIQRGHDFARLVEAIQDDNVLVTTTWLDADASRDDGQDQRYWSPAKYLSALTESSAIHPKLYGENKGMGSIEDMLISAHQMRRYRLVGMAWFDESQLLSDRYATLTTYEQVIKTYQGSEA